MTPEATGQRQRENLDLVRRAFDAFDDSDIESVLALADPDVEVYMPATMPNGGTFHGHHGYLLWVGRWLEAWDEFSIEVRESEPVGDAHVITHVRQRGIGRGSGVPVEMNVWYVNELRDRKFVALHLYPTYEEALEVAERRESSE